MTIFMRSAAALILWGVVAAPVSAATYQSENFEVTSDSASVAREIAEAAEEWRRVLARHWFKRPLQQWDEICRIQVSSTKTGGSGWTNYEFLSGDLARIDIEMKGPPNRLLEYVLPHELTHVVLVTELNDTLPRWADEGAAMLSESRSQQLRQLLRVKQLIKAGSVIPFDQLFSMRRYPRKKDGLQAFYAQSFTLCEFLIERGGRGRFLQFVQEGRSGNWDRLIERHYKLKDAEALQAAWSEWALKKSQNPASLDAEAPVNSETSP